MNILAAIDFSPVTEGVLSAARKYARLLGARLWLVHVEAPDPNFVGYEPGPQTVRDQVADDMRAGHRALQEAAERCRTDGITTTALLVQGPTAETLVSEAGKLTAEMIIIGSHGHGAVHHLLVGSVSEAVLRHALCPVLVVPDRRMRS